MMQKKIVNILNTFANKGVEHACGWLLLTSMRLIALKSIKSGWESN
jgi:hypothetical protein